MTPSVWRDGGRGETIRWATAETDLGTLFVAATGRGICRVSFDEDEAALAGRFPHATIEPGGADLAELVAEVAAYVAEPGRAMTLPLDVRGTAFQEAVWRELSRIPPGETLSYAALAAKAANPGAARAAGSACGANHVAVLDPLPPRATGRRDAGRLCLWPADQAGTAEARAGGGVMRPPVRAHTLSA